MSERYSKLFALPENLYAAGSPVVIAAGALLKDNQTGKVIAQLKMRNISQKPIKAAKVCIHPLDTVGNPLGEKIEYQYLDLSAARDEDFGQKAPVALADASTRSFTASVEEIVFADNSIWTATGEPWEVLDAPGSLRSIGDAELIKQFRLKYGNNCKNLPLLHKDLWYCACGELNRQGEAECHRCQKSLALLEQIDMDALRKERDTRVAAEKEQAEKEAAAAKAHAKKMGKIAAIVVPILVVLIVVAVIISNSVKKSNAYEFALTLVESGQYEDAIEQFAALGDYKDSAEQIQIAEKAKAEADQAAEIEAKYNTAIQLLSTDSVAAYELLLELGDYKDAQSYLDDFQYLLIEESSESGSYTYRYDSYGRLTSRGSYTYIYDDSGKLLEEGDGWNIKYEYSENGLLSKVEYRIPVYDSSGKSYYSTINCNEDGYPISIKNTHTNSLWKYQYNYAEDGTLESLQVSWHKIMPNGYIDIEADGAIILEAQEYTCLKLLEAPNLSAPLFRVASNDGTEETIYELTINNSQIVLVELSYTQLDSYGNPILYRTVNVVGRQYTLEYENSYDEHGNLIRVIQKSSASNDIITYEYTYGYVYCPDAT